MSNRFYLLIAVSFLLLTGGECESPEEPRRSLHREWERECTDAGGRVVPHGSIPHFERWAYRCSFEGNR